jgi:hypothetical protein
MQDDVDSSKPSARENIKEAASEVTFRTVKAEKSSTVPNPLLVKTERTPQQSSILAQTSACQT